jgi:hypothetical protein
MNRPNQTLWEHPSKKTPKSEQTGWGAGLVLRLTPDQEALLAPIVRDAVALRQNVIFLATAAPEGGAWRFQVATLTPAVGLQTSIFDSEQ